MRKKGKYYAVNKQEDEDGYNLCHGNVIIYGNKKSKQNISSCNNTINTYPGPSKLLFRSFILSPPALLS